MISGEKCKLLKIYVSEDSEYEGHSLYNAILYKLKELGIAGVTVSRGIKGFGHSKTIHQAHLLDISPSLPIIIEAVDTEEKIEKALPVIKEMVNEGLIFVINVTVVKYGKR